MTSLGTDQIWKNVSEGQGRQYFWVPRGPFQPEMYDNNE